MKWSLLLVPSTLLVVLLATGLLGTEPTSAQPTGLSLPFLGIDHLLAATALGVWAGRLGGEAPVLLPAAFVLGAALGLAMAWEGVSVLVLVRPMVWASVAALTLAAIQPARLELGEAGCLAGLFGLFHGHAIGAG